MRIEKAEKSALDLFLKQSFSCSRMRNCSVRAVGIRWSCDAHPPSNTNCTRCGERAWWVFCKCHQMAWLTRAQTNTG